MGLRTNHLDAVGYRCFFWGADWRRGPGNHDGKRAVARAWILMSDWCGGPTARRNHDEENPDAV